MAVSYIAQVIADGSGKWAGNGLRFATAREAEIYVRDLACRWTLVRQTRVVASDDAVNARVEPAGDHLFRTVHLSEEG